MYVKNMHDNYDFRPFVANVLSQHTRCPSTQVDGEYTRELADTFNMPYVLMDLDVQEVPCSVKDGECTMGIYHVQKDDEYTTFEPFNYETEIKVIFQAPIC